MRLLFISDEDDPVSWREHLLRHMPDLEFITWPAEFDPATIDFALVFDPPPGLLKSLPNLKAVLSLAAGLDHLAGERGPHPDVPVEKLQDPALATLMAEYVRAAVMRHPPGFSGVSDVASCRKVGIPVSSPSGRKASWHIGPWPDGCCQRRTALACRF